MPFSIIGNRSEAVESFAKKLIVEIDGEDFTNGEKLELMSHLFESFAAYVSSEHVHDEIFCAKRLAELLLTPLCPGETINVPDRDELPSINA